MSWAKGEMDDFDLNMNSQSLANKNDNNDIDCFADVAGSFFFKKSSFVKQPSPSKVINRDINNENGINIISTELKLKNRSNQESKKEWLKHKDVVSKITNYTMIFCDINTNI